MLYLSISNRPSSIKILFIEISLWFNSWILIVANYKCRSHWRINGHSCGLYDTKNGFICDKNVWKLRRGCFKLIHIISHWLSHLRQWEIFCWETASRVEEWNKVGYRRFFFLSIISFQHRKQSLRFKSILVNQNLLLNRLVVVVVVGDKTKNQKQNEKFTSQIALEQKQNAFVFPKNSMTQKPTISKRNVCTQFKNKHISFASKIGLLRVFRFWIFRFCFLFILRLLCFSHFNFDLSE